MHLHWTLGQWKNVLWSDESHLTLWQSDGRIWQFDGQIFGILPALKFDGGEIMVSSCFQGLDLDSKG